MKYNKLMSSIGLSALLAVSSCTADFDEINKNPNAAESTNEIFFLTKVILSTAYDYQKESYMDEPASAGRYITMVRNEGNDNFGWSPKSWDSHYYRLSANKELTTLAAEQNKEQYVALSKILGAFNFAYITDLYGDIPYSDALQSKDNQVIYPAYDQQSAVYTDLLATLKEANTLLQNTSLSIDASADILYGGSTLKWRKFANSLRLRLLLRASKNYPQAIAEIQEIVNDPVKYPIFTSNDDNAEIPYLSTTNKWPGGPTGGGGMLTDPFAEFIKRKPSKEVVDFLVSRNDPRLPILIAPVKGDPKNATVDHNPYVGVPNSISTPYEYNGGADFISTLNTELFYQDAHPMVKATLLTYTEICFILAEVVQQKGVTVNNETAETLYYKGIGASLEYWRVEAGKTAYIADPLVKYDGTLKQLIGQKWIALFIKGSEGWFDYRRTNDVLGFNALIGPVANQRNIPYRYIYPDGERNLNRDQYDKAISAFGEDTRNTLMWLLK